MLVRRIGIVTFVIGCVCASSQAGLASSDLKKPGVIKVTGREITQRKNGTRIGDVEVTRLKLFNRRITSKSIGRGELVCVYLGDHAMRNCTGAFALPKGKIVVGGTIVFADIYDLAVLGGTGLYNNVRGTLTVTSLSGKPPSYLLLFRLVV
jgi:hypothetical protein